MVILGEGTHWTAAVYQELPNTRWPDMCGLDVHTVIFARTLTFWRRRMSIIRQTSDSQNRSSVQRLEHGIHICPHSTKPSGSSRCSEDTFFTVRGVITSKAVAWFHGELLFRIRSARFTDRSLKTLDFGVCWRNT